MARSQFPMAAAGTFVRWRFGSVRDPSERKHEFHHQSTTGIFSVIERASQAIQRTTRPKPNWKEGLIVLSYLTSSGLTVATIGGAFVLMHADHLADSGPDAFLFENGVTIAAVATLSLAISGVILSRMIGRRLLYLTAFATIVTSVSLVSLESVARLFVPHWPACDLHGIDPTNQMAFSMTPPHSRELPSRNRWGQRDRDHSLWPEKGVMRIAIIGDSFVEEGAGNSLPALIEHNLNRPDVELINLGVSATAPDEYYYRLENIALPLECQGCVMCIYLGNDLAAERRTLPSWLGIAAVSPRPSLLTRIGLRGLNHILTNRERPVQKAWNAAGGLAESEDALHRQCLNSSDEELAEILIRHAEFPGDLAAKVRPALQQPDMASFYQMLRQPDDDRFRSYYLFDGLWLKATGSPPRIVAEIPSTLEWIRAASKRCREHNVQFLVVLIPEGFSVDPRLRDQWQPLAEMRRIMQKTTIAGRQLEQELQKQHVDVLNLYETLNDQPGCYLNLDGHWSELGTSRSAAAISERLEPWLSSSSGQATTQP